MLQQLLLTQIMPIWKGGGLGVEGCNVIVCHCWHSVCSTTNNTPTIRLVDGADDFDAGERTYQDEQSWTLLEEDEQGRLRTTVLHCTQGMCSRYLVVQHLVPTLQDAAAHLRPRRRVKAGLAQRIRRGMIRYVQLVIDMSRAAAVTDWRPNRLVVMAGIVLRWEHGHPSLHLKYPSPAQNSPLTKTGMVEEFITHFFDENPLSQMGIIALRDGIAVRLSDLSSTPELHKAALRKGLDAGGDVSLQNGLDMAVEDLNAVPPYGSREVLFLFAALSTCDPGNILTSITAAKNAKCRVSIVGLAAEVYVCKHMAKETGGGYAVALNEHHLLELLHTHAAPPPWADATMAASLVHMGFPQRNAEGAVTFIGIECGCGVYLHHTAGYNITQHPPHLPTHPTHLTGADCTLSSGGFTCPRCLARLPTLPCSCFVCGLTCVLSPHIARSYHHLFPLPVFEEVYHLQEEGKGHAEGVQV